MKTPEKRFHKLMRGNPDRGEDGDHFVLSNRTLCDDGYLYCVATVLLGDRHAGILHSGYGNQRELNELATLIEVLSLEEHNLKGIIIAGADNIALKMNEVLKQANIPLVSSYYDHYAIKVKECGCCIVYGAEASRTKEMSYWRKEVVVNPRTSEVLIHSKKSGYVKLHPSP